MLYFEGYMCYELYLCARRVCLGQRSLQSARMVLFGCIAAISFFPVDPLPVVDGDQQQQHHDSPEKDGKQRARAERHGDGKHYRSQSDSGASGDCHHLRAYVRFHHHSPSLVPAQAGCMPSLLRRRMPGIRYGIESLVPIDCCCRRSLPGPSHHRCPSRGNSRAQDISARRDDRSPDRFKRKIGAPRKTDTIAVGYSILHREWSIFDLRTPFCMAHHRHNTSGEITSGAPETGATRTQLSVITCSNEFTDMHLIYPKNNTA